MVSLVDPSTLTAEEIERLSMFWRSISWHNWVCLSFIVFLAIGLRCFDLGRNCLWTDEYLSMECSSGWGRYDLTLAGMTAAVPDFMTLQNARPMASIWSSIATDENHPPLYFVLLRAWRDLFGDSYASIRSLSVVAAVIAILLLFAIGVVVHGPRAGLWACLLMAIAIPQIQQSQDARAYIPMTAVCLGVALALVLIERHGPTWQRCVSLCFCALAAPLLHYMAFATLGAMILYATIFMRGSARKWVLISFAGSIGIFSLLWGPQALSQHYRMMDATGWLVVDPAHRAQSVLQNVCTLPARLFLDLDFDAINLPVATLSAGVLLLPVFFYRRYHGVMLWWIWLIVPVATVLLIDLSSSRRSMSMVKYTMVTAPAVFLMLGLLAAQVRRTGWIPAALIAICCAICLPGSYASDLPDWREMSRVISHTSSSNDPVLFADAYPNIYGNDSLLSVCYYMAKQHRALFVVDRTPAGMVREQLSKARHACVIADSVASLERPLIPGLSLDRTEFLFGMALVGKIDPPKPAFPIAKGTLMATAIATPPG